MKVAGYDLVEYGGIWFLTGEGGRTVSTLIDMGGGNLRARTPEGSARTVTVPDGTDDPARYVAEQIT